MGREDKPGSMGKATSLVESFLPLAVLFHHRKAQQVKRGRPPRLRESSPEADREAAGDVPVAPVGRDR